MLERERSAEIRRQLADKANADGMVAVTAGIDGLVDNGRTYRKGQTLHMHLDLLPEHLAAGMVRVPGYDPAAKQSTPPADKQVSSSANKAV
jgi:hypothetical protein